MTVREMTRTGVLCSVELVGVMGATLVLTTLPLMLRATGASDALSTAAISTGYAVGFGGFLVLGARIADWFGHVRAIVVTALVFAVAAVMLAMTSSVWSMAGARLGQGLMAAVMVPAALALISRSVPDGPRRRRTMAAWGATSATGGAIGFLVGSLAAATGWWRAAYLLQGLLALLLAVLVAWLFRTRGASDPSAGSVEALDLPGGLLITVSLGGVVAGTSLLTSRTALGVACLALTVVVTAVAVVVERRCHQPVLQVQTLRKDEVASGSLVAFVNTATTSSAATLLTLALQDGSGEDATSAALTMLPFSLGVIAGSGMAPKLMTRCGDLRAAGVGLGLIALGTGLLPLAGSHLWLTGVGMAVSGVGIGISAAASTHLGTSAPGDDQAPAAALLNTAAQLGTAVGVAASVAAAGIIGEMGVWWALAALAAATALWTSRRHSRAA